MIKWLQKHHIFHTWKKWETESWSANKVNYTTGERFPCTIHRQSRECEICGKRDYDDEY